MSVPPSSREGDSKAAARRLNSHLFALIRFQDGSGQSVDKNILHESTLIGSAKGTDLRLKSANIAPVHCLITLDRWRLSVRDLSGGETRLNGQPVTVAALADGDVLSLGVHEFKVRTNLSGSEFHGFYLDHYEVTEVLGSGGMCWLYGGRNSLTHEPVALKVLPSNFTPRTLAHFSLEARVGQRLGTHPQVIRMARIVRADPVYCIIMEYLEGISLQELVERDGPVPWPQACHLLRLAALGLDHVHRLKIVHRDVKPNNFILCRDGNLKLIDFNLAWILEDDVPDRLLQHYRNHVVGTADYISPEQSLRSDQIDTRSDLYSLGCIFHYLLTGTVLFPIPSVSQKLQAHRTQLARSVCDILPAIPTSVGAIAHRLLEKTPQRRYQSAGDLAADLEPLAHAQPVRFDWAAVLAARAATARKRLAKLLAKQSARRREAGQDSSVAVTDTMNDTPNGSGISQKSFTEARPLEFDLFATLDQGTPRSVAEQHCLSELFHLWPQLTPAGRNEMLLLARKLEQSADGDVQKTPGDP